MPALIVIIDEYAELADEAPDAMSDTDSIARLGRAVAVTLIAATQRPTQKAMGQGAVRSQMDLRICFRVREPRDVDLVLGQGMLRAGWDAHNLNAPGKFLGLRTRARYGRSGHAPTCSPTRSSRKLPRVMPTTGPTWTRNHGARLIANAADTRPVRDRGLGKRRRSPETNRRPRCAEQALWLALCMAPRRRKGVSDLMRATGMTPPDHLPASARAGQKRAAPSRSAGDAGARGPPRSRHRE